MDKEIFLNVYKSLVRPHLEYAVTACTSLYKKYGSDRKCPKESHKTC